MKIIGNDIGLTRPLNELIPGAVSCNQEYASRLHSIMSGIGEWRERLALSAREGVGFAAPGGEFTKAVYAHFKKNFDSFTFGAGALPVVELGAGMSANGYRLALQLGAASYVGIEAFYSDILLKSIAAEQIKNPKRAIPFCILAEDMLSALRRIPDRSVTVFAFGIEECILAGESYRKKVEQEVRRIVSEIGYYLSLRSDLRISGENPVTFNVRRRRFIEKGSLVSAVHSKSTL